VFLVVVMVGSCVYIVGGLQCHVHLDSFRFSIEKWGFSWFRLMNDWEENAVFGLCLNAIPSFSTSEWCFLCVPLMPREGATLGML